MFSDILRTSMTGGSRFFIIAIIFMTALCVAGSLFCGSNNDTILIIEYPLTHDRVLFSSNGIHLQFFGSVNKIKKIQSIDLGTENSIDRIFVSIGDNYFTSVSMVANIRFVDDRSILEKFFITDHNDIDLLKQMLITHITSTTQAVCDTTHLLSGHDFNYTLFMKKLTGELSELCIIKYKDLQLATITDIRICNFEFDKSLANSIRLKRENIAKAFKDSTNKIVIDVDLTKDKK